MKGESNENNLGMEEEKKESSPTRDGLEKTLYDDNNEQVKAQECLDNRKGIPLALRDKVFQNEGMLWEAQEKLGLSDLQIVLNSEGYAVWREMPEIEHDIGVDVIHSEFLSWNNQHHCGKLFGKQDASVFVVDSYEKFKNHKRNPDFAIWGPDRLDASKRTLTIKIDTNLRKKWNPHVIFQFSWGNSFVKEKRAVNDMSEFAGIDDFAPLERPNVIYLIKVIRKRTSDPDAKTVYGFDVYVVRTGETIITGANPTLRYRVGRNEDVIINVTPEDMGLPVGTSPFLVSLSEIRTELEEIGVDFEPENQDG